MTVECGRSVSLLAAVPDADDDNCSLAFEPVAQHIRPGGEGNDQLAAAGLVRQWPPQVWRGKQQIGAVEDRAGGATGSVRAMLAEEVDQPLKVGQGFGKPADRYRGHGRRWPVAIPSSHSFTASWATASPVS